MRIAGAVGEYNRAGGRVMAKVTSADCKAWIIEQVIPDTKAKDWKRRKKYKQGDAIVRIFDNDVTGESVGVVEKDGEIIGAQEEQGYIPAKPMGSLLEQLKSNPIKVAFLPLPPSEYDDLSGRMVYDVGEEGLDDDESLEDEGIGFYCGPETKSGWLHDTEDGGCTEKLEKLFADLPTQTIGGSRYPAISVQDAENYHTVALIPGISPRELWALIVERLERSGAVKMKQR